MKKDRFCVVPTVRNCMGLGFRVQGGGLQECESRTCMGLKQAVYTGIDIGIHMGYLFRGTKVIRRMKETPCFLGNNHM